MLLQSLLGIVYSDDWLAFIREVYVTRSFSPFSLTTPCHFPYTPLPPYLRLNMRMMISIYRQLGKWIESVDAAYTAHPEMLERDGGWGDGSNVIDKGQF
jgi:hypothetical protein